MVAAGDEQALHADPAGQGFVENRLLGIPGLLFEQAVPGGLHPQGDSGQTIGEEVDKQQMHRGEGDGQGQQGGI